MQVVQKQITDAPHLSAKGQRVTVRGPCHVQNGPDVVPMQFVFNFTVFGIENDDFVVPFVVGNNGQPLAIRRPGTGGIHKTNGIKVEVALRRGDLAGVFAGFRIGNKQVQGKNIAFGNKGDFVAIRADGRAQVHFAALNIAPQNFTPLLAG